MNLVRWLAIVLGFTGFAACRSGETDSNSVRMVEFKSSAGNRIVAPSNWTVEDQGALWILTSPDGAASINVFTFTVDGTGSLDDLKEIMLARLGAPEGTEWESSQWSDLMVGGAQTSFERRYFVPTSPDAEHQWRVYVTQCGQLYHAIVVTGLSTAVEVNGGFYEELIGSFVGIASVPPRNDE